jgi:hypothetical protein
LDRGYANFREFTFHALRCIRESGGASVKESSTIHLRHLACPKVKTNLWERRQQEHG